MMHAAPRLFPLPFFSHTPPLVSAAGRLKQDAPQGLGSKELLAARVHNVFSRYEKVGNKHMQQRARPRHHRVMAAAGLHVAQSRPTILAVRSFASRARAPSCLAFDRISRRRPTLKKRPRRAWT